MPDEPPPPDPAPLPLVLASGSPRRADLLRKAGFEFTVLTADIDESAEAGEDGVTQALRLAREKVQAVCAGLSAPAVVLGADTLVLVDKDVLGKPADMADALAMLRRLNGREHEVVTAVAVVNSASGKATGDAVRTRVRFGNWSEATLGAYAATGEGLDKAGAYAIQDGGGSLVASIEGSASNVIGLPVAESLGWIAAMGGPQAFGARP